MAGLLFKDGKPAFLGGKPLIGDNVDCCCGVCCCAGALSCCQADAVFTPGMNCGGANHQIQVRWQWQVNGAFCRFSWDIIDFAVTGFNGANGWADYLDPSCTAPAGVWTFDPFNLGDHGAYDGTNTGQPLARCTYDLATVTISKVADGYQFSVAGVQGALGCDCSDMNGVFLVECP